MSYWTASRRLGAHNANPREVCGLAELASGAVRRDSSDNPGRSECVYNLSPAGSAPGPLSERYRALFCLCTVTN